nr:MAG TPA: hypothetical protein [Caudoviricetes sp.]
MISNYEKRPRIEDQSAVSISETVKVVAVKSSLRAR